MFDVINAKIIMLKRRVRSFLSLFLFLYLLVGCRFSREVKVENTNVIGDKDRSWLLGKTINCIDSIVNCDSVYRVLYIFDYNDCHTCISVGFQLVNRIDSLNKQFSVNVVTSTNANLAPIQRENNYRGYIFIDERDLIRRELKYSPTPMLIMLNRKNEIVEALIPTDDSNNLQCRKFLNSCIKNIDSLSYR